MKLDVRKFDLLCSLGNTFEQSLTAEKTQVRRVPLVIAANDVAVVSDVQEQIAKQEA